MKNKIPYLYILICTFFFSSMEVALKSIHGELNPIQINFIRFLVGGVVILPLAFKKLRLHNYRLSKNDYLKFSFVGFLQIVVSMSFYTLAIQYVPANITAIILSCNIFFSIIFAYFLLQEKIYKSTIVALLFYFAGMFIIIKNSSGEISNIGLFYCLIATILFGLYGVVGKYFSRGLPIGGVVMTSFSFLFGVTQMFFLILLTRISFISNFFIKHHLEVFSNIPYFKGVNMENLPVVIYICLGVTGLGFATYFLAIDALPMSTVSLVFFIKPVLAPIISFFVLKELIPMTKLYGLFMIVIGSVILFYYSLKRK